MRGDAASARDISGRRPSVAAALARDYLAVGQRALAALGDHALAVVWEPARRRVVVRRGGRLAEELLMWSDGRFFAFGIEPAQVLAALSTSPGWSPGSRPLRPSGGRDDPNDPVDPSSWRTRLARLTRLGAGETVPVTVTAAPPPSGPPGRWPGKDARFGTGARSDDRCQA